MFSRIFRMSSPLSGALLRTGLIGLAVLFFIARPVYALSLVRDAEIESIFRQWATPILQEARVNPDEVSFHLVNDPSLNMFVAGGQRIFVHTGFIMALDDPAEAIGVLAHEIGHIAGGHLSRSGEQRETAKALQFATMILGAALIGAGAATDSDTVGAGSAILGSSSGLGLQNFLAYSRVQESAADQAALRYLKKIRYTSDGLALFLDKLQKRGNSASIRNEYLSSHPLTDERIKAVENAGNTGRPASQREKQALSMMKAKLIGFLYPQSVGNWYGRRETSDAALYAWAIADYRKGEIESALKRIDILLERYPETAWYLELKGQVLAENGRYQESLPWYSRAMRAAPENLLLREIYGDALVRDGNPDSLAEAEGVLKAGRHMDPYSWRVHDSLARLFYKTGRPALSDLSAAEKDLLGGRLEQARTRVERAIKGLDTDSPDWYRAQDILNQLGGADNSNKK